MSERQPDDHRGGSAHVAGTLQGVVSATAEPLVVLHTRIIRGHGGGPEKTILSSPRHLAGSRYRAAAAYLHDPADPDIEALRAAADRAQCPLITIPDHHPIDIRVLSRLAEVCRKHRVRIWHGHDYKSNLLGILLRRKVGLQLATTVHGWVPGGARTRLYHAIDRWCLRRYDRVVAVSSDLFDRCLEAGVPAQRLRQIDNGIDLRHFRRRMSAAPKTDRIVIGSVGRLAREKGFHLLVDAAVRLLREGLDIELRIAGEGPEECALARQIEASGYCQRIRLLGHQSDVRAFLDGLDVFALTSLTEALPNSLLEAMAMEVAVVATDCGSVSEVLQSGRNGLLCSRGSLDELTALLRRVARSFELRSRLAAAGRLRVESAYDFHRRMQRMVAVYDELIAEAPRVSAQGRLVLGRASGGGVATD